MITIYHNPRCSKSREGLEMLTKSTSQFTVNKYLDKGISIEEIHDIINKLGINPIELIRQKEAIWLEKYKGRELTDSDIIEAMHLHPQLIERPIVVNGNKAIIARPAKKINSIL